MMKRGVSFVGPAIGAMIWVCGAFAQSLPGLPVLTGSALAKDFAVGLNTSDNRTNWLSSEGSADLLMQYPGDPSTYGVVFFTVGTAVATNRPGIDLSGYQTLVLELSGDPGTSLDVGIKDASQPDDGRETKVTLQLTADWQTYEIPLAKFTGVNLNRVYVLTEFVFTGPHAQTARVRSIRYATTTTKVLPQFVFGGGWYSAVYFTNSSASPIGLQINFIGDDGNPLNVPSAGGSTTTLNLPPYGTGLIEAPNSGNLTQGYVSVALPDGVAGYGVFRQSPPGLSDQEAVVPLSGISTSKSTLIWDDVNLVTAVAVVNPSSQNITVNITVRGSAGQTIGTSSLQLPAKRKTAVVLRNLPGLAGMVGDHGSVDFTASAGSVAVLGLRFKGLTFTSIPTTDR